ncbi:MAG: mercury methylation ferredoxin HgcB [bacterium]
MNDIYLKNIVTLELDKEKCIKCGMCLNVCPREVLAKNIDNKVTIISKDKCIECGACAKNCPVSAITVNSGVGCAYAIIKSKILGGEPNCGCSEKGGCC